MKSLISLGSLIDTSFEHYKKHLAAILGITLWLLVAALPSAFGILLARAGYDLDAFTFLSFGLNLLGGILTALASLHITVALILTLREQRQGKTVDPRTFLKKAFSLDLSYLWATILKSVFVAISPLAPLALSIALLAFAFTTQNSLLINVLAGIVFITLLVALGGAIKFSLSYAFVPYATVLDGARGMESLRVSAALVRGRWWDTFWRSVLPKALYTLIFVIVLAIILWITGMIAIAVSQESFLLAKLFAFINFSVSTLANAFFIPLLLLNDYYLYENLRETK